MSVGVRKGSTNLHPTLEQRSNLHPPKRRSPVYRTHFYHFDARSNKTCVSLFVTHENQTNIYRLDPRANNIVSIFFYSLPFWTSCKPNLCMPFLTLMLTKPICNFFETYKTHLFYASASKTYAYLFDSQEIQSNAYHF